MRQAADTDVDASTPTPASGARSTLKLLRVVLGLIGVFITVFGLNIALGGIETLGWEGRSDFIDVTDQDEFDVQDNHVRFIGGVWTAMGLVYLAATRLRWLYELRITVAVFSLLIFVGGLARLSSGSIDLLLSGNVVGSLTAELVLAPLLGWWVVRATAPPSSA